jgi:hypothetical protein
MRLSPLKLPTAMSSAGAPRAGFDEVIVQHVQTTRYALKPKLGATLRVFATLLGKAPADQECVILTEDVPAFVRCDGPLYLKGPVWRIETTSAR